MDLPKIRKAWVFKECGPPRQVLKYEDLDLDTNLSPHDVLVKVKTVGLNPVDYKFMTTSFISWVTSKPCVPAMDVAGIVVKTGSKVTHLKQGDKVIGKQSAYSQLIGRKGTLTDFVRIHQDQLTIKPDSLDWDEAGGLLLTGLTAWQALLNTAKIKSGMRILIVGASGGVGTLAVQIAKAKGCYIVGICSGRNADFVKQLGADEILDYTTKSIEVQLADRHTADPFDVILDCIDVPAIIANGYKYLKPEGQAITVGDSIADLSSVPTTLFQRFWWLLSGTFFGGRKYRNIVLQETQTDIVMFVDFVNKHGIKVPIDSTFEKDQAVEAFERLMTHRAKGKVIVRMTNE